MIAATAVPYATGMAHNTDAVTPETIRALRTALGESVTQFGKRFGRSGRTVEDWEQGRRRPDVMVRMALHRMATKRALI